MISRKSDEVLSNAGSFAVDHDHQYCTLEHVFWALLDDPEVRDILDAVSVDYRELRTELETYLENEVPRLEAGAERGPDSPVVTVGVQNLLQRALFHVQSSGKDEVRPRDLFVALF